MQDLQNGSTHRSKAQFPITRPIAPDPRRSSHLSPVPVRETLEQDLRLKV